MTCKEAYRYGNNTCLVYKENREGLNTSYLSEKRIIADTLH